MSASACCGDRLRCRIHLPRIERRRDPIDRAGLVRSIDTTPARLRAAGQQDAGRCARGRKAPGHCP